MKAKLVKEDLNNLKSRNIKELWNLSKNEYNEIVNNTVNKLVDIYKHNKKFDPHGSNIKPIGNVKNIYNRNDIEKNKLIKIQRK
jgi:hypothetical protein